jgi:hypothetical protein
MPKAPSGASSAMRRIGDFALAVNGVGVGMCVEHVLQAVQEGVALIAVFDGSAWGRAEAAVSGLPKKREAA